MEKSLAKPQLKTTVDLTRNPSFLLDCLTGNCKMLYVHVLLDKLSYPAFYSEQWKSSCLLSRTALLHKCGVFLYIAG